MRFDYEHPLRKLEPYATPVEQPLVIQLLHFTECSWWWKIKLINESNDAYMCSVNQGAQIKDWIPSILLGPLKQIQLLNI